MATRVIDDTKLQNIAVAIQSRDSGGQMTVDEMPTRIENIPSGGGTLISKTITKNGVYNASSDNADGYDVVTVDVPEKNTLEEYLLSTLDVADLPNVTSLPSSFFREKKSCITANIPKVTVLEFSLFAFCARLKTVILSDSLTTIKNSVFYQCGQLVITTLPNTVTTIGDSAFWGCGSLPYLDFSNFTNIPSVATQSFDGSFPFYFRDQQQLDEWAAATNWSTYADRFQIKPSEVI